MPPGEPSTASGAAVSWCSNRSQIYSMTSSARAANTHTHKPADQCLAGTCKDHHSTHGTLSRRGREPCVGEDKVLLEAERLVAGVAVRQIGVGVGRLVRPEGLILPLAVANIVGILGAPAGALLHYVVSDDVGLDEAAVRILHRIALRIELRSILHVYDHRSVRQRLAALGGLDRRLAGIELAVLLVVGAVERGKEHALRVVLREGDLFAGGLDLGLDRNRGGKRGRARDERDGVAPEQCHLLSSLAVVDFAWLGEVLEPPRRRAV